ncbi:MAG: hypothetical protein HY226_04340 [Candidatus Vogelbacteria bacterium]|nr:hypothetical protein [Candidatus Vogelbacteria bacterium]
MFLNDGDHPMVRHKDKIINFLDDLKKIVKDDGGKIDAHVHSGCPECRAAADEIREKIEALEDLADGIDGDVVIGSGTIDQDDI